MTRYYSQWDFGFNLAWELDFWGKFRRAVEADAASLDASVESFDDVVVTLLSDIATNYVQTAHRRAADQLHQGKRQAAAAACSTSPSARFFKGKVVSELDYQQQRGIVAQTEALIPELEISLRQYETQLCILLGIPPMALKERLGHGGDPGIPRRQKNGGGGHPGRSAAAPPRRPQGRAPGGGAVRPDRRGRGRSAAAHFHQRHHRLLGGEVSAICFRPMPCKARSAPSFQWNILNYGRILNNRRLQEAKFQELVATYQKRC